MRGIIKITSLSFGLILLITIGLFDSVRQRDSTAYWLLLRQPVGQNNQFNYFLASPDGQVKKTLFPSFPENYDWYIAWSFDGQHIFYRIDFITDETPRGGIFSLNIYSGITKLLIEDGAAYEELNFIASPDKKWFALPIPRHDGQDLYIISADMHQIEALPAISFSPINWSPDSQAIYYEDFFNGEFRQFKLNIQSQVKTIVSWAEPYYRYAPDGTAYAFFDDEQRGIWYVHDLQIDETVRITPDDGGTYVVLGWIHPDWLLVLENIPDHETTRFYRVKPDGSSWQMLYEFVDEARPIFQPFWDKNAEWVYFDSVTDEKQHQIERFNIDTLDQEVIIPDFKPLPSSNDFDYRRAYLGKPAYVKWVYSLDTIIWWQPIDEIPSYFELHQTQSDGTDERILIKVDDYYELFDMQISPDNQWVYVNLTARTRNSYHTEIWRANLRHRQQEQLFNDNTELISISPAVELHYSTEPLKWGGFGLVLVALSLVVLFRER